MTASLHWLLLFAVMVVNLSCNAPGLLMDFAFIVHVLRTPVTLSACRQLLVNLVLTVLARHAPCTPMQECCSLTSRSPPLGVLLRGLSTWPHCQTRVQAGHRGATGTEDASLGVASATSLQPAGFLTLLAAYAEEAHDAEPQ